jgi:YHS domain-containing protein
MKPPHILLTVALAAAPSAALAQDTHQMSQGAGGSAEVAQCIQAQAVVAPTLDAARARLEMARQTNSPTAMRAAVDTLDALLLDVRTRLQPCGQMSITQAMANMPAPATQNSAAAPAASAVPNTAASPAGQNMSNMPGHNMANMPTPATQKPAVAPVRGAAPAAPKNPAAAPPAGQNVANMAGHNMANMPAPATQKRATGPQPGAASAAPAATNQAAAPTGHNMASMPSAPSAAATKPATPAATQPDMVEDPVSKTQVDSRNALRVRHQGRMYYFRSDKERQEFLKNPAKYVSGK